MFDSADIFFRRAALFLIVVSFFSKLSLLLWSPLNLAPDETLYWLWSRDIEWAYYNKGSIVALVIAAGTAVFGDTAFGVRFPALVCGTLMQLILLFSLRSFFRPEAAYAAFFFFVSCLFFFGLGIGMDTDAPCLLLWVIAIHSMMRIAQGNLNYWLLFGLATGLATLTKYSAFYLLPSAWIAMIFHPQLRRRLLSLQAAAGLVIFAICLVPILIWNMNNEWVNIAHNAGHMVSSKGFALRPNFFFELLGSQLGLLGPLPAVLFLVALCRSAGNPALWLVKVSALPLIALMLITSISRPVYANWPMPIYLHCVYLLAASFEKNHPRALLHSRLGRLGIGFNVLTLVLAVTLLSGFSFFVPASTFPTKKLRGWDILGQEVGNIMAAHVKDRGGRALAAVISDRCDVSSEIAFYAPGHPQVMCHNSGNRRMTQYDIWGGWEELKGKDLLLVFQSKEAGEKMVGRFDSFPAFAKEMVIEIDGKPLRRFFLFVGEGFSGQAPPMPGDY